jgi:hypothetical protein
MMDAAEQIGAGKVSVQMKAALLKGGISDLEYGILSRAVEEFNGDKFITPEGIRGVSIDTDVKLAAAAKKLKPAVYLRDLELRYAGAVHSGAMISSTTAGAAETAVTNLGTQAGTTAGEVTRLLMQFKSFGLQGFNILAQVLQSAPDEQALTRGVLMGGKKNWSSMAQLTVMGIAIGYLRTAIQDVLKGENVKDPTLLKTWTDAAAKSGLGGLYGDMLFNEQQRYGMGGVWGALAGPTFGQTVPLTASVVQGAVQGKGPTKEMKKEAVRLVRSNIPFQNAPLAKNAFDYLQHDVINESLFPGSAAKRRLNQKRYGKQDRTEFPYGEE